MSLLRTAHRAFPVSAVRGLPLFAACKRYELSSSKQAASKSVYDTFGKETVTLADLTSNPYFDSLLRKGVAGLGFSELTPVQEKTILPFLQEDGLVCRARTGTGKTNSFVFPIVQHVMQQYRATRRVDGIQALIIAPTRDLALQIVADIEQLTKNDKQLARTCHTRLWVGGTPSRMALGQRDPAIVVGTPGRILANVRKPYIASAFSNLAFRVYDEADRMLEQGFEEDVNAIDDILHQVRSESMPPLKNLLFSATIDRAVTNFAETQMSGYRYINCVSENELQTHHAITQRLVKTRSIKDTHRAVKEEILRKMEENDFKGILFMPTIAGVDFMYQLLRASLPRRSRIWRLHGKLAQGLRKSATEDFKKTKQGIMVCTDVAARGMDFKLLTDVYQISPSQLLNDYIHKIGRTGRAGTSGRATLVLSSVESGYAEQLQSKMGIEFKIQENYDPAEEEEVENRQIDHELAELYAKSLVGFLNSVFDLCRIDSVSYYKSLLAFYRTAIQDESATLEYSSKSLQMMGVPRSLVGNVFTVSTRRFNNDDEFRLGNRRNSYGNDRGYGRDFDRGSYGRRPGSGRPSSIEKPAWLSW